MSSTSDPLDFAKATAVGSDIIAYLERDHSGLHPMNAAAGMAMALGAMVATLNEMGLTKQGRTGALLAHLFNIAEQSAISGTLP